MLALLSLAFCWHVTAQYCASGPTTTVDGNLGATRLVGDSSTINDQSNCPGTIGPKDLTNLSADLTFQQTVVYQLQTTVTTCGNEFPTLAGAWIDWNQNDKFETDELLGNFTKAKNQISWSFTVPPKAMSGKTRLRVQVQETQASTINPCAYFPYGGTKDFTVYVNSNYCSSGPTTSLDGNLGGVSLTGEDYNIREYSSQCPGPIGVQNFLNYSADILQGSSYVLSFNVTSCGSVYQTASGAWIDWDHDLLFNEDALGFTQAKGLVNISFTVPTGKYLGDTVLRVQVQETASTSQIDPCSRFAYGGTKDYTIVVKPPRNTTF